MASRTRPQTTLFLIHSVDGRVVSHDSDHLDPDKTWKQDPKIAAISQPFFEFAKDQNIHTLTYGSILEKLGLNTREGTPVDLGVNLAVIDDTSSLNLKAVNYLAQNTKKLYFFCPASHPAAATKLPTRVSLFPYQKLNLKNILKDLKKAKVKTLTLQSYTPLNARWLAENLIDELSVIISPLLVGIDGTPTLIGHDLPQVKPLIFTSAQPFGFGFVNLRYKVINSPVS
jgi:2,5-diamino-6-(ribosylamino)-4(3H)-pyrimidinone 5'-phosphate reductase